ncbi:MAG: hypothetical protein IT424_12380 [Pirellulales bacterium]|nr:hypothetical protein [Pirellulales bacterium]
MHRSAVSTFVIAAVLSAAQASFAPWAPAQSTDDGLADAAGWQPAVKGNDAPASSPYNAPPADAQPLPNQQSYAAATQSPAPAASPYQQPPSAAQAITPTPVDSPTHAQVTKGPGTLPNDHGQVWREYDITPYTIRNESTQHPEQAIVDWILRETGYEAWHSTPVGLLSADRKVLRCYHTPQMQAIVAEIVDRFISAKAQNHGFGLRIMTLKNPNWRTRALPLMTSIPVQSPGVQGWIMAREDGAILLADLRQRTDFREHSTAQELVLNGQTSVVTTVRPLPYVKGVIPTRTTWPGYQPDMGSIDEGFTLEFSPLVSTDATTTDAVVKLRLSQVEKMIPVQLEIPSAIAPNQKAQVDVPQLTMLQMHERFRWPTDHVLLLSIGVVATPGPEKSNPIVDVLPLPKTAPRADALLMVESRGATATSAPAAGGTGATGAPQTAARRPQTFHGRY